MPPQIFRPCPLKCSDIVPSDIETLPPQMFRPCPIRFQTLPPPCTVIVYHGHQAHLKVKLTRNHTITALPKADGQMEAKTKSSSLPPGQMEYILRGKTSALMSSSDSD